MPGDNEMVNLIIGSAQEGQFDKMSIEEMERIYNYGYKLSQDRPYDEALIGAINKFKEVIYRRNNNLSVKTKSEQSSKSSHMLGAVAALIIGALSLFAPAVPIILPVIGLALGANAILKENKKEEKNKAVKIIAIIAIITNGFVTLMFILRPFVR